MAYLAACCVFKDELPYLREWVEYHRLVGVERLYMVSNDPSPAEAAALLKPYIDEGLVRFGHGRGPAFGKFQNEIYRQILAGARGKVRWLAFLDADEFLLPVTGNTVPEVLAEYEGHAALAVNWACFGSSGLYHAPKLQTAGYRMRLPDGAEENRSYKSIVDPERAVEPFNPHRVILRDDAELVDEFRAPVNHPWRNENDPFFGERLRINHYRTRSAAEFEAKLARWRGEGHPELQGDDAIDRYWDAMHRDDCVADETIMRFVPELERRLSGRA
jgi:hypothetical protein